MATIKITSGSRIVISSRNEEGCIWSSRLYVNNGETATLIAAKHSTENGVRKWAAKALANAARS